MDKYEPRGTIPVVGDQVTDLIDSEPEVQTITKINGTVAYSSVGRYQSWGFSGFDGYYFRILKRDEKDENEVGGNNSEENDDKVEKLVESRVLSLALERISRKTAENGPPENSFELIADFWAWYLEAKRVQSGRGKWSLTPDDVAAMMILMKVARHVTGAGKEDNAVDIAGYAHFLETLRNDA